MVWDVAYPSFKHAHYFCGSYESSIIERMKSQKLQMMWPTLNKQDRWKHPYLPDASRYQLNVLRLHLQVQSRLGSRCHLGKTWLKSFPHPVAQRFWGCFFTEPWANFEWLSDSDIRIKNLEQQINNSNAKFTAVLAANSLRSRQQTLNAIQNTMIHAHQDADGWRLWQRPATQQLTQAGHGIGRVPEGIRDLEMVDGVASFLKKTED